MEPSKALYGPAHQPLEVVGNFIGEIQNGCNSFSGDIFVVRGLKSNLLGLQALTSLKLLKRLCATSIEDKAYIGQFPKVFSGLGTLGDPYTLKQKPDTTPYALFAPRNVPIPLREKVKEELDRMEQ